MTLREITKVYFWICALLCPLAILMFLLGALGLVSYIISGDTPRDAWSGSKPDEVPYLSSCLIFIIAPIWGFRVWLIHHSTLKGQEDGASNKWGETALFNIGLLIFWVFIWSQNFDHKTYFLTFILLVSLNTIVSVFGIWIWQKKI